MEQKRKRRSKRETFRYNTLVTCKWSEDEQIKLIEQVKRFRCLYDESSPPHTRKLEDRILAWQQISESFGDQKFPLKQCRAKWLVLRESYRRNLAIHRKTGKRPSWLFYDQMKFVVCHGRNERFKLLKFAVSL